MQMVHNAAHHANKLYEKRRKNCGRNLKLISGIVREYVLEKQNLRWSSEQIAGRSKLNKEPYKRFTKAVTKRLLISF